MTITQRLQALRSRLRILYASAGGLRLVVEVLAFLILQYFLDRWLRIPQPARLFALVVLIGIFLYRVRRLIWYPLQRQIGVRDMALAVERTHRQLGRPTCVRR